MKYAVSILFIAILCLFFVSCANQIQTELTIDKADLFLDKNTAPELVKYQEEIEGEVIDDLKDDGSKTLCHTDLMIKNSTAYPIKDDPSPIEVLPMQVDGFSHERSVPKEATLEDFDLENLIFSDSYTELDGIITFRGNPSRDHPAYGYSNIADKTMETIWSFTTATSSWGGGAGWTGQASIVKWEQEVKAIMNLYDEYKNKDEFVEVIYASLDGNIYFFDLETGKKSRDHIIRGNPFKGSVSIDPRGYPVIYIGDGIPEKKQIGYNIYSLIDGSKLFFINGIDSYAYRSWGAFDASGLIHKETDTLILPGENGILYIVKLNTEFDVNKGRIAMDPLVVKYRYKTNNQRRFGIESSPVVYRNFLYLADNGGWIQCINLNTLEPVWLFDTGDDTDATITLEVENGIPYLYTANEVDHRSSNSPSNIRKINGITGEQVWQRDYGCLSTKGEKPIDGGAFATNVIGKHQIDHLVIFTLARHKTFNQGIMVALDKETGEEVWTRELSHYAWSSPVAFYDEEGDAYIIQCDSIGNVFLLDGKTGKELYQINLGSNIESSPVIYEDYIVVATRGQKIFGIKIK